MSTRIDTNMQQDIGLRLRFMREKKFGNQRGSAIRCAELCRVTASHWSDLEAGRTLLNAKSIMGLVDKLKIPVDWLLTGRSSDLISLTKNVYGVIPENRIVDTSALFACHSLIIWGILHSYSSYSTGGTTPDYQEAAAMALYLATHELDYSLPKMDTDIGVFAKSLYFDQRLRVILKASDYSTYHEFDAYEIYEKIEGAYTPTSSAELGCDLQWLLAGQQHQQIKVPTAKAEVNESILIQLSMLATELQDTLNDIHRRALAGEITAEQFRAILLAATDGMEKAARENGVATRKGIA